MSTMSPFVDEGDGATQLEDLTWSSEQPFAEEDLYEAQEEGKELSLEYDDEYEFEDGWSEAPSEAEFLSQYDAEVPQAVALLEAEAPPAATDAAAPSIDDFVAAALTQRGDPYVYGAEASFNDANPSEFDCSELVQWAAARAGLKFKDGAQNQRDECRRAGTLIPVEEGLRTRGALLFRIDEGPRKDHVAISLGDGTTMEAKGPKFGVNVFPARDRRWTHAGIIPGFRWTRGGSPPPPSPAAPGERILKRGLRGEDVRWLQRRIQMHGVDPGPADGIFGKRTEGAVRSFQTARGLAADGIVGPRTVEALSRPL
jgi:cell wall-associated NlpC family hydrolase